MFVLNDEQNFFEASCVFFLKRLLVNKRFRDHLTSVTSFQRKTDLTLRQSGSKNYQFYALLVRHNIDKQNVYVDVLQSVDLLRLIDGCYSSTAPCSLSALKKS